GCTIQRLTGNPMASPAVLGISSGAAFGVVWMLFLVPGNAFGWLLPAGSLGAAVTLLIILLAAGRGGLSPHRSLLSAGAAGARRPGGGPGRAGDLRRRGVWRGVDAVSGAGQCLWLGVTCRQSRGGGDAVDHYDRRRSRGIFPTPHVTGGDGVKYRVHHAFD